MCTYNYLRVFMASEDLSDTEAVECSETESDERSEAIQQVNSLRGVGAKLEVVRQNFSLLAIL